MAYVPNPDDASQPVESVVAETCAAEFRALKAKVNTLTAGAASNISQVRNTVLSAYLDANGAPALLAAGVGLAASLQAALATAYFSFADGFGAIGSKDNIELVSVDSAAYWPVLFPFNTNFLSVQRTGAGLLNAAVTLAPPQYSPVYDRAKQFVLQFGGAVGSTVFLDDFGNTWAAQGAAKVETNYFKFGTGALGGGGATNALDGATDWLRSLSFTTLGADGWSIRGWCKPLNALPGAGNRTVIFNAGLVANGLGVQLGIYNNAGTIRFFYSLSGDGATNSIVADAIGTTTPALGTEYFLELTYDALAGTYRLYVNGAQEQSTASAVKISGIDAFGIGARVNATLFFQGYVDKPELLPYCQHPNGTAYVVPAVTPNILTAGYASEWFDTNMYLLKIPSAVSAVAGTPPTFTSLQKIPLGEMDTSGAAVTATRVYAYRRKYTSALTAIPAVGTRTAFNHNIGTTLAKPPAFTLTNFIADIGFTPGMKATGFQQGAAGFMSGPGAAQESRNVGSITTGSSASLCAINRATGVASTITPANWKMQYTIESDF